MNKALLTRSSPRIVPHDHMSTVEEKQRQYSTYWEETVALVGDKKECDENKVGKNL